MGLRRVNERRRDDENDEEKKKKKINNSNEIDCLNYSETMTMYGSHFGSDQAKESFVWAGKRR